MSPLIVEPVESEEADPKSAAAASSPPQIQYESAASPISRRQFRLLFLLTLVNTIMLFLFVAGPGISRISSGWWQDYKRWQADRLAAQQKAQAAQKFAADFQAALQFASPENQVIYEEDTQRAAKLLTGSTDYTRVRSSSHVYFTPEPWQLPVLRRSNGLPAPFQDPRESIVFLHSRMTPSGVERVVRVEFTAETMMRTAPASDADRHFSILHERVLISQALKTKPDNTLEGSISRSLQIMQPQGKFTTVIWSMGEGGRWENGRIQAKPDNVFRIFAGQPDAKNVSHFTITYELDGKPGIIDGWLLNDESVALQPREGRIVQDDGIGRQRQWDPYAAPPATRPIVPPDLPPLRKN